MGQAKRVLVIGLAPQYVDYSHWPGLTAEALLAGLNAQRAALNALGYETQMCLTDDGATAGATAVRALTGARWDCVVIGAGVRLPPEHLHLFETLINAVHRHAPDASICFNTNPLDTADAVRRWV